MQPEGIVTVEPDDSQAIEQLALMMGDAFLEEGWFTAWLGALDELGADVDRKRVLLQACFMDDLTAFAPYQGVYMLPDATAATGAYRFSELGGETLTSIKELPGRYLLQAATEQELELLDRQERAMDPISVFDWQYEHSQGRDHINFFAWAVAHEARGTGALRRLLTPFFEFADAEGLNCYLECYSDRLQNMYEHLGFELVDVLHAPGFETTERRMVRPSRA